MSGLGAYISGAGEAPSRRVLNRTIERWEWFTTARRARAIVTGEPDPALVLPLMFWPTVPADYATAVQAAGPDTSVAQDAMPPPAAPAVDLIDRFIEHGGYRIVPSDYAPDVEVEVDIDPEMVTPELAEIYRAQGLVAEAEKIYHLLNLRNS